MQRDPILASKRLRPSDGYNVPRVLTVEGGLHFIKSNGKPYFSLTYTAHRVGFRNQCYSGGAGHDFIEQHFPGRFTDLAALHLSDIDGVPMHAEVNGWYRLAGCFPDAFGERYHSGNSQRQFWKPDGSFDGYRLPAGDECLAIFADHCRIPLAEAAAIRDQVQAAAMAAHDSRNAVAKAKCAEILATMRPRWKAEADACIAKHGLRVYGDPWPAEEQAAA